MAGAADTQGDLSLVLTPLLMSHHVKQTIELLRQLILWLLQQSGKLIATNPVNRAHPQHISKTVGHPTQHLIAEGMTPTVIESFEVINIKQQQPEALPLSSSALLCCSKARRFMIPVRGSRNSASCPLRKLALT